MRLKHRIEYGLVLGGLKLGNLFPWDWISATGAALGAVVYHVLRLRRRVVMENLDIALGEETSLQDRRRIAAACYRQFGRSYFEYFGLPRFHQRGMMARFDFEGLQHVEAARSRNKGVVFMSAHFGNMELGALATHGGVMPVHILVGDLSNRAVGAAMDEMRRRNGLPIERRGMGLRQVMRVLRRGESVGIPADQEARWHGVQVPLFGRQSLAHPGGAYFGVKTGAPLVPTFHVRHGRRHRIVFMDPIYPAGEGDEAVRALTAAYCRALEEMVRRHPDHWFWMHKRWKKAPKGPDGRPLRVDGAAG
jgi:KDO2-lipid IV(A) lauroyltransferase